MLWGELRFALRTLRRSPGFTLVAVLLLALGIGANTAIFSVVEAMLLRPLPYRDPDRLVMLWEKNAGLGSFMADHAQVALVHYQEWKRQNHVFEAGGFFQEVGFHLTGGGQPEQVAGARASLDFFDVLGVAAASGRTFQSSDRGRLTVISGGLCQRRFGAPSAALGRSMALDGQSYTIIGVLPRDFRLPAMWEGFDLKKPEIWVPLEVDHQRREAELNRNVNYVFARLKPGATVAQARAEMDVIGKRLEAADPGRNAGWGVSVFPLRLEDLGRDLPRNLLVLQVAVGFVLLIAGANLMNLVLARVHARHQEIAIRLAVGAGLWRLGRQFLAESLLVSVAGGAAGLAVAWASVRAMVALAPSQIHQIDRVRLNLPVFAFALAATAGAAVIFGIWPAVDAVRRPLIPGRFRSTSQFRNVLATVEIALAVMLLAGAGLMVRSLSSVLAVPSGFRADHLLTAGIGLARERYPRPEQVAAFGRQLLDRVSALPGVVSASLSDTMPLQSINMNSFQVEGQPSLPGREPFADGGSVTPEFFRTMGIPILRGRGFTSAEPEKNSPVIVNEAFARRFWPGGDALGKALRSGGHDSTEWRGEVVGVAGDTRQLGLDNAARAQFYFPAAKWKQRDIILAVRTTGDPDRMADLVRREVWAIDKDQPVGELRSMESRMSESLSQRRFNMLLLSVFGGLALVLSAVGIYGVLSWSVGRRMQEIGVRMALGAQPRDILRSVAAEGLRFVGVGIALGMAGALALGGLMRGLLYAISPSDPLTLAAVPPLLVAVAAFAIWLPARRAARVDPLIALRHE